MDIFEKIKKVSVIMMISTLIVGCMPLVHAYASGLGDEYEMAGAKEQASQEKEQLEAVDEPLSSELTPSVEVRDVSRQRAGDVVIDETKKITVAPQDEDEPKPITAWFPDPALAGAIAQVLNVDDASTPVTSADLKRISTIRYDSFGLAGNQIKSLVGLEFLTNLASLELRNHEIDDLAAISELSTLTALSLVSNNLSDRNLLQLRNLQALEHLDLHDNQIVTLDPLQGLTNVVLLRLSQNKIREVNALAHLKQLTHLWLDENEISDLSPLSSLPELEELDIGCNNVEDVSPLGAIKTLQVIELFRNFVSDLTPLRPLINLRHLSLGKLTAAENNITDFSVLTDLPNLDSLHLEKQGIEHIPVQVLETLKELFVPNTGITDIRPFLPLINLMRLELNDNHISDLKYFRSANFPLLTQLNLSNNKITDLTPLKAAYLPELALLDLSDQKATKEILHKDPLIVENNIKDFTGNIVAPRSFEPAGQARYESPNIIWTLPMPEDKTTISYNWSEILRISKAFTEYSGTVAIDVLENYTVQFFVDDAVYASFYVVPYTLLRRPTDDPVKIGHEFVGWFTAPVDGVAWNFTNDTMPKQKVVLYAHFNVLQYRVTYNDDGCETNVAEIFGLKLSEPKQREKLGYTFVGWFTAATDGVQWDFVSDTMPAHNLTLFARYTVNSYEVRFDNDGEVSEPQQVKFGERITEPAQREKLGYTFVGWFTAATDGVQWDFASRTMPASDLTLFARFTVNSYEVRFDNDGRVGEAQHVDYGALVAEPIQPDKLGYTFTGWYTEQVGGRVWDFARDTMPASNLTLFAQWERARVNENWVLQSSSIKIPTNEFFALQVTDKLEGALIERANLQVFDDSGRLVYHSRNAIFTIRNIIDVMQIKDVGEYNIEIIYIGPQEEITFVDASEPELSTTVKLVVADVYSGTNDGVNNNKQEQGNNNLMQTGNYTVEEMVLALVLIGASLILLRSRKSSLWTEKIC